MDRHSKEFKELQKHWYSKLERTGFDDVESNEDMLTDWHSTHFKERNRSTDIGAIEEYYRIAGHFLHSYQFESKKEQTIWSYHSEGLSVRDIVSVMRTRRFKVYKRLVHETIQRLKKEMMAER